MTSLLNDCRFFLRTFSKSPGFTLVILTTLALGIGGSTAMFSVVRTVLLRPLPYFAPEQLVRVQSRNSYPDMEDWIEQNQSFEAFGGYAPWTFDLTGVDEPERLQGFLVTGRLFQMLGAKAALGRVILPGDDRPEGEPVVLLSNAFWKSRYGSDETVLGRSISLSGKPYAVIGIMPPDFRLPRIQADVWAPCWVVSPETTAERGVHNLVALGRLKPEVHLEQAQADMDNIAQRLESLYPEENTDRRFVLERLQESVVRDTRRALLILFGAVTFVLLVACANVANLLLARANERQREISVRTALGAGKLRIIRQLLTEAVLLSVAGGALGVLLAHGLTRAFVALAPEGFPRLMEIAVDPGVLAFTLGVSVLSGLLFGLAPAAHAMSVGKQDILKEGGRSSSGILSSWVRSSLIAAEVALSVVLLVGAGLLFRSFINLQEVNPGFRTDSLLTMDFTLPTTRYREIPKRIAFFQQVLDRIESLPGVEAAAATTDLPFGSGYVPHNLAIEGLPMTPGSEPEIFYRGVSPNYFRAMEIPLLEGRSFSSTDREDSLPVAIINEKMARQWFTENSPIGRRTRWARRDEVRWLTIVGVVGDVKSFGLDTDEVGAVYVPFRQEQDWWRTWMNVVVRTSADPTSLAPAVRTEVAAIDSDIPVANVQPIHRLLAASTTERRLQLFLIGSFAAVALVLASVGIYGALSNGVAQRTNEIGIRMALGAAGSHVLKMVIRQGITMGTVGLALGFLLALPLTQVLSSLLFELSPTDPVTFIVIGVVFLSVALVASFLPARRATRVDPMEALRHD